MTLGSQEVPVFGNNDKKRGSLTIIALTFAAVEKSYLVVDRYAPHEGNTPIRLLMREDPSLIIRLYVTMHIAGKKAMLHTFCHGAKISPDIILSYWHDIRTKTLNEYIGCDGSRACSRCCFYRFLFRSGGSITVFTASFMAPFTVTYITSRLTIVGMDVML